MYPGGSAARCLHRDRAAVRGAKLGCDAERRTKAGPRGAGSVRDQLGKLREGVAVNASERSGVFRLPALPAPRIAVALLGRMARAGPICRWGTVRCGTCGG